MVFIPHDRIFYRVTEKQTKLRCGNTSRLWVNVFISAVLSFPELLRVFLFYLKTDKMFSISVKTIPTKTEACDFGVSFSFQRHCPALQSFWFYHVELWLWAQMTLKDHQ